MTKSEAKLIHESLLLANKSIMNIALELRGRTDIPPSVMADVKVVGDEVFRVLQAAGEELA